MSPTVFRYKSYRFFFFSREEPRMHVHVAGPHGQCKYWLEPKVSLANHRGLTAKEVLDIERVVKENADDFRQAWKEFFEKS